MEDLSLDNRLLAVASLALVLLADDLSLSITVGADSLETLNHRTHLAHHGLHAMAITTSTLLHRSLLSTTAFTSRANDGFLECELGDLASVNVFQRDLVDMVNGTGFWRATLLHTPTKHTSKPTPAKGRAAREELREEVFSIHTASTTTTFQSLFAILVIYRSLLGVRQNLIRMGEVFKFFYRIWVMGILVYINRQDASSILQMLGARAKLYLPGWCFNAPTLYAFFNSCSVQVGATWDHNEHSSSGDQGRMLAYTEDIVELGVLNHNFCLI